MIKKFLITLLLFIGFFGGVFAGELENAKEVLEKKMIETLDNYQKAKRAYSQAKENEKNPDELKTLETEMNNQLSELNGEFKKAKEAYDSSNESENDFSSIGFKLNVDDVFPTSKYSGEETMEGRVNIFFADIIQKLMIGLGSVALLLMTIGAGFMIFYHGEDNLLTKGKSIFSAGIISLVVALLSFYMIEIVKYLIG